MPEEDGTPHYYASGEDIIMVTSFGVGWASPTITEMVADEMIRPAVALGAMGGLVVDGEWRQVNIPMAAPWIGLAQLAGQIEALRGKLPQEFELRWHREYEAARAYADANLDSIRVDGAPE